MTLLILRPFYFLFLFQLLLQILLGMRHKFELSSFTKPYIKLQSAKSMIFSYFLDRFYSTLLLDEVRGDIRKFLILSS